MWSKMLCLSFWHLQYGSVRDDSWLSSISPYSGLLFEEHWFTWYFNDQRLASWTSDTVKRLARLVKTLGPRGPRGALFVQHGRLFASYPSYPSYPTPILISTSSPHLTWIPIPRIGPFWNHFHQNLVFKENLKKKNSHILRLVMNFGQNLSSPTIVRPVSYRAKTSIYFNLKDSPGIKPN